MTLDSMLVDLSVVLGRKRLPIHQFLSLKRGAVVALDAADGDEVEILANGHPIARGRVTVHDLTIAVEVTNLLRKPGSLTEPGARIGGTHAFSPA